VLVLALDTSSAATSVALCRVGARVETLASQRGVDARAHGEVLAPLIEASLRDAGATPGDLAAIVAGVGPGPFTGLRVGLVTAAVFGAALHIPTYGVCSLDGIGAALVRTPHLLVAGDARRREVYFASYAAGVRVTAPDVAKPADVAITGLDAMAGSGARIYAELLGLALLDYDYPAPSVLVEVAAERIRTGAPSEPLTPLYLRRPDAVEPGARKKVLS
jgi:tRNA threonylcarbamoyl adenosine modification protein YeaZ